MAQYNKYGVDVSSLVNNKYVGDLDAFKDQNAIDALDVNNYSPGTNMTVQGLTGNTQIDYANSAGLGGLTQGTWNNLGQAAGLAGGMYNMYDNLFGNKADLYKQQIGNLKDQRAYNAQTIANQKQFKSNIGSGFSGAFSNGLAASRVG